MATVGIDYLFAGMGLLRGEALVADIHGSTESLVGILECAALRMQKGRDEQINKVRIKKALIGERISYTGETRMLSGGFSNLRAA